MNDCYYVVVDPRNEKSLWWKMDINAEGRWPLGGGAIICFNTEQEAIDHTRMHNGEVGIDDFILNGVARLMPLSEIKELRKRPATTINLYSYIDFELKYIRTLS